jgi:energy-coupling factor transporter ATP-binding protein EcfA2
MESIWETYPPTYRTREVNQLLEAVNAGECAWVIGLSGSGKSNLAGFFTQRVTTLARKVLVDGNRLTDLSAPGFFRQVRHALGDSSIVADEFAALEGLVETKLKEAAHGLCLVMDRFERLPQAHLDLVGANLRALRDAFKYQLTYVVTSRCQPDPKTELAELFFGHLIWLGPLAEADALWSAAQFAARNRLVWDEAQLKTLFQASGGYASLLRAACEAAAKGCPLEVETLQAHPTVRRRVDEFLASNPAVEDLDNSGLSGYVLLDPSAAAVPGNRELTASEERLLVYLRAHAGEVCEKDALIKAVWPEDRVYEVGIRDDSLAQLARRLRCKVESDPANPKHILTIAGRGYRYKV